MSLRAAGKSYIGQAIGSLPTPCLLVDKKKVTSNCGRMFKTCEELGISLRAQTKTHKTKEGAMLQTGGTKRKIVVSTLEEAEFYTTHGFDDILYGYPLIPFHLPRCKALAAKLEQFHVMVDNMEIVNVLEVSPPADGKKWSVFLKVDCGNNRAGVWWSDPKAVDIAQKIYSSPNSMFQGIYAHCGNSYKGQVQQVRDDSVDRMQHVVQHLKARGIPCHSVGTGSTPSCSQPGDKLATLTEIHPGNYIFYDVQQLQLGSCQESDIAACVATRVIGHYPRRNQLLIDCGFTALTKQGFGCMDSGYAVFQGHPELKLVDMTQEIGKVEPKEGPLDYSKYPVGTMLFLYPYHSCATAGMHPVYYIHEEGIVVEEWMPTRGW